MVENTACNSMLALCNDGTHYHVREDALGVRLEGSILVPRWPAIGNTI